jgi:hypothetical protein
MCDSFQVHLPMQSLREDNPDNEFTTPNNTNLSKWPHHSFCATHSPLTCQIPAMNCFTHAHIHIALTY